MPEKRTAVQSDETLVLHLSRHFDAPREAVFHAWTDPDALAQWMGPRAVKARDVTVDLRVGGRYSLTMDGKDGSVYPLSGTYREIVPPKRLVFTFAWGHGDLEGVEMLVTLDFTEERGGTLLSLTQTKVPSERARDSHTEGWTGSFDCLADYLAS